MMNRLKIELQILRLFEKLPPEKRTHFTESYDRGKTPCFKFIVMELVGKSVYNIQKDAPKREFSLSTAFKLGIQTLEAIEHLHELGKDGEEFGEREGDGRKGREKGESGREGGREGGKWKEGKGERKTEGRRREGKESYLHRDIKPHNYSIGIGQKKNKIYILDFGIARKFVKKTGTMILRVPRERVKFLGTLKYASRACHYSKEQSRKDDLEAWLYMQLEFIDPQTIFWAFERDRKNVVVQKEKLFSEECKGKTDHVPPEILKLVQYLDGMQ
uniref:Protein kinase domain-containing protein n=1 Tax=Panagrolaimus sp. JU765 TaxID=591449 RepID=A0AC34R3Y0_9BILA